MDPLPAKTRKIEAKLGGSTVASRNLAYQEGEDPPLIGFEWDSTTVTEGEDIKLTVKLSWGYSDPFDAELTARDNAGALENEPPFTVAFGAGETSKEVAIATNDDQQAEGSATVEIWVPSDASLLKYQRDVRNYHERFTVLDNDTGPSAPRNLTALRGDARASLQWDAPLRDGGQPVSKYQYRYSTDGGGNWTNWGDVPDSDESTRGYTAPGLTNDVEHTFEVRAYNVAGGGDASNQATVTPFAGFPVTFNVATLSANEASSVTLTVTLGQTPTAALTIPLTATPGTGLESNEYSAPSSVNFAAGETSKTFTVTLHGDENDESNETLTLGFGSPLPGGLRGRQPFAGGADGGG